MGIRVKQALSVAGCLVASAPRLHPLLWSGLGRSWGAASRAPAWRPPAGLRRHATNRNEAANHATITCMARCLIVSSVVRVAARATCPGCGWPAGPALAVVAAQRSPWALAAAPRLFLRTPWWCSNFVGCPSASRILAEGWRSRGGRVAAPLLQGFQSDAKRFAWPLTRSTTQTHTNTRQTEREFTCKLIDAICGDVGAPGREPRPQIP
jgi:hypothetical protein